MTVNGGWPDADEWAESLLAHLKRRSEIYVIETDTALLRKKAAGMIAEVVRHLEHVPGYRPEILVPLKDLMIFSEDMDNGVRHPWSRPNGSGGTSIESFARTELRRWVVVATLALIDAGYSRTDAYKRVESVFNKSGRCLSWRGVQGWVRAYEQKTDRRLAGASILYETKWQNVRCAHGHYLLDCPTSGSGKCSLIVAAAEGFSKWASKSWHLRDRFKP